MTSTSINARSAGGTSNSVLQPKISRPFIRTTALAQATSTEAVTWLQSALMLPESGVYDQATVNTVAAWQRNNGYGESAVDGVADGKMIRALA